jgi:hypothetical protein
MAALILAFTMLSMWPDSVVRLSLQFDPGEWAYACVNPDSEIQVQAVLTTGGMTYPCTMQVRGQTSSYYPKKSIKVRLAEGYLLYGFDELNLNAQYTDRSRIRENLCYLFHAHCGQIVSFAAMTEVFYNGATQGPYLFVEDVDGDFALRTWLPDDAVVYKCREYGASLNSPDRLHLYLKKTFEGLPDDDLEWFVRWLSAAPDSAFVSDISSRVHFDALLSCVAANILLAHGSTYYHNYHMVLDEPGTFGRWRMIPWDMDKTWGSDYGPDWPYYSVTNLVSEPNTLLWRIWTIPQTRALLLQRLAQLSPVFVEWASGGPVDSLAAMVQPLVMVDPYRDYTMEQFGETVQALRDWPAQRVSHLSLMISDWPLPFRIEPTSCDSQGGVLARWTSAARGSHYQVRLSTDSTFLDEAAVYWETMTGDTSITIPGVPGGSRPVSYLQVRAANPYRTERALNRSVRLTPQPSVSRLGIVPINEVFYRNDGLISPGDWVELVNAGTDSVDLAGWAFRDTQDRNLHVIGDIILAPGDFLILMANPEAFFLTYPDCPSDPDPFQFGLSADGEILRLYNPLGVQVDYVPYLPVAPWPEEPANDGWSLSLLSPDRDNSRPESWTATPGGGTPGLTNNSDPPWSPGYSLDLQRLCPNPAGAFVTASVLVNPGGSCVFRVYDLAGREVLPPLSTTVNAGMHSVTFDVGSLPSGLYFLQVSYAGMRRAVRFTRLNGAP